MVSPIIKGIVAAASLAAQALLRPKPSVRSPNVPLQQSSYGVMLPIIMGTTRSSGNIIWATRAIQLKDRIGEAKGSNRDQYFVDFAVDLGKSRVERINRIWADGEIIYDQTGGSDAVIKEDLAFRLLSGDPDQEPDPLIVLDVDARLGEGSTPAYRGKSIVVFETFLIQDFANRIPNLNFEIVADQEISVVTIPSVDVSIGATIAVSAGDDNPFPDWDRGLIYFFSEGADRFYVFSIFSLQVVRQFDATLSLIPPSATWAVNPATGNLVGAVSAGGTTRNIATINSVTGEITDISPFDLGSFERDVVACHNPNAAGLVKTIYAGLHVLTIGAFPNRYDICFFDESEGTYELITTTGDLPTLGLQMSQITASAVGTSYAAIVRSEDNEIDLYGIGLSSDVIEINALSTFTFEEPPFEQVIHFGILDTLNVSEFAGASFDFDFPRIAVDTESLDVILVVSVDGTWQAARIQASGAIVWRRAVPFPPQIKAFSHARVIGGQIGWMSDNQRMILLDVSTGEFRDGFDGEDTIPTIPVVGLGQGGNTNNGI